MSAVTATEWLDNEVRALLVRRLGLEAEQLYGHALLQDWRRDGDVVHRAVEEAEGYFGVRLPSDLDDPLTTFDMLSSAIAHQLHRRHRGWLRFLPFAARPVLH